MTTNNMAPGASTVRRRSGSASLLVIDDACLRTKCYLRAERTIREIHACENRIALFYNTDQRLFNDWYNLTFRGERELIEARQREYDDVARFYNWVIAAAKQLGISMAKAFRLIKDEAWRYTSGNSETRRRIEADRQARDRFIHEEIEKNQQEERDRQQRWSFDAEEMGDGQDPIHTLLDQDRKTIEALKELSDSEIRKLCRDRNGAFAALDAVMELSQDPADFALFFRVWDQLSPSHQKAFARKFANNSGLSLYLLMDSMREVLETIAATNAEENPAAAAQPAHEEPGLSPKLERFKLIYRKLVRRLHPDLQPAELSAGEQLWLSRTWERVQTAYKNSQYEELEKLFRLTLLRQKALSELTMSEIEEGCRWFEDELNGLKRQVKELTRMPAWNFSTKKSYRALVARFKKSFERQMAALDQQIDALRMEHEALQFMDWDEMDHRRRRTSAGRWRG